MRRIHILSLALAWQALVVLCPASLVFGAVNSDLERAFRELMRYDSGDDGACLAMIDAWVRDCHADAEWRGRLEKRLLGVLEGHVSPTAKRYACRFLSVMGTERSIPVLASCLEDESLCHIARLAMERIGGASVQASLRAALDRTNGMCRIAVIHALGSMRDEEALTQLGSLLGNSDANTVCAALTAIGRIGTENAAKMLMDISLPGQEPLEASLEDARLRAAQNLQQGGREEISLAIYRHLYQHASRPHLRTAGFKGLVELEADRAQQHLLNGLASEDTELRGLAARLVSEMPFEWDPGAMIDAYRDLPPAGQLPLLIEHLRVVEDAEEMRRIEQTLRAIAERQPEATEPAILDALPTCQGQRRIVLLNVLRVIGGKTGLEPVLVSIQSNELEIRDAAVRVLGDWPDAAAMPHLVKLAESSGSLKHYVIAFRGVVRLIRASEASDEGKARALRDAMRRARRKDEKLLVLAAFGDVKSLHSLKRVEKNLYDPEISEEAAMTVLSIVSGLENAPSDDILVAVEQVLRISRDPKTLARGQSILRGQNLTGIVNPERASRPEANRIILLAGPMDHAGPGAHEHGKDLLLLKRCLDQSTHLGDMMTELHFGEIPREPSFLEGAATLVVHSSADRARGETHALFPSFQENYDSEALAILQTPSLSDADEWDVIAWAVEREGGGRGFAFTGCHFHDSLQIEDYRRCVLNAICWAAGVAIPPEGVF